MIRKLVVSVLAVASLIVVAPVSSASAAIVSGDVPLQPGAPVVDGSGVLSGDPMTNVSHACCVPGADLIQAVGEVADGTAVNQGSYCTLNFVFRDKSTTQKTKLRTYIGTSTFCTTGVGQRVKAPGIGSFGTVVFSDRDVEFALIQIDANKQKYVSRVVRGYGAAPSGYATSRNTKAGDLLLTHGYPAGGRGPSGITRLGLLESADRDAYVSTIPVILDRGSPVIRTSDGKAVGVSNEFFWPLAQQTVESVLLSLKHAGFNVTL